MPDAAEAVLLPSGVTALDARLAKAHLLDVTMEAAGRAVADEAALHWSLGRVLVLCGGGANGGDALVAARHLHALGKDVEVLALRAAHPLTQRNARRLSSAGPKVKKLTAMALRRALKRAQLVIDGLLGTGFSPPLRPETAELLELINASGLPVLSIDLPSGLDAASAELPAAAVRASRTLTFCGFKPALLFGPANHLAATVTLADLRLPPAWAREQAVALRLTDAQVAALLPRRFADAHKGVAGRVWIVGGQPGTVGAAALAGQGALRSGAGLVTLYSEAAVPLVMPELMVSQIKMSELGSLLSTQTEPDAVAVGMGLGPRALSAAKTVLGWHLPTVIDADALQSPLTGAGHAQVVWTPHPGEAARLLATETQHVTRDPISAATALQRRYGGVIVLKGGPTTIATPQQVFVSRGGHPGMAKAGMGDTLSGVIASLLGQGLSAEAAALAGVRLHAKAGELAAERWGYGLSASDLSEQLGAAWLALQSGAAPRAT